MLYAFVPKISSTLFLISSVHPSAPNPMAFIPNSLGSIPSSRATSPRWIPYEGVKISPVVPKSFMISICLLVCPVEIGMIAAPTLCDP